MKSKDHQKLALLMFGRDNESYNNLINKSQKMEEEQKIRKVALKNAVKLMRYQAPSGKYYVDDFVFFLAEKFEKYIKTGEIK